MRDETRVPVLVGIGTARSRPDDECAGPAGDGVEAIELMRRASTEAFADAGLDGSTDHLDWVGVPEGTWSYRDPGRLLAAALRGADAGSVHTVLADVGILQQQLLDEACVAVTNGGARLALVAGGEAKHRARRAAIDGTAAPETAQDDMVRPDDRRTPASLGVSDLEIVRNTVTPVAAYALIENAIGHRRGRSLDEHRDAVAALWSRFAAVAAHNPEAWDRTPYTAAQIRDADPATGNRMISFPYTKRHSAQWNVDQAAALLFCSLATARSLGVPEANWVFPHASVVSNHAVPLTERRDLHRSVGAEMAGGRLLELAGTRVDQASELDLYSCFPAAVELFAAALGIDADAADRQLTVTGGLAFAGGPLNNYVLQALVTLARQLRGRPDRVGLSSSVSGFLVKQGFSLWAARPPERAPVVADVSDETAAASTTVEVGDRSGPGTVATWTVDFAGPTPSRTVAVVDLADGTRTIAATGDLDLAASFLAEDPIGTAVVVHDGGELAARG